MKIFLYRFDVLALDGANTRVEDPALWTADTLPGRTLLLETSFEAEQEFGATEPFSCPYLPSSLGLAGSGKSSWLFTPTPISHDRVQLNSERNSGELRIRVPASHALAQRFALDQPGERVFLTVAEHTSGSPGAPRVLWVGELLNCEHEQDGKSAVLRFQHMLARLQQPGLTRRHPRIDPSNPFDPSTGRLKQSAYDAGSSYFRWREDGSMTIESDGRPALPVGASEFERGRRIVVPEAANRPDGWLDGGYIVIDGSYTLDSTTGLPLWRPRALGLTGSEAAESDLHGGFRRSIAAHVGDTLTLDMPLPVADYTGRNRVTAYLGYDGSLEQAEAKFGTLQNYWGFPWIPTKNPFTSPSGLKQS